MVILPPQLEVILPAKLQEPNTKQNQDFQSLLVEFADIFSQGPGDLGKTNIITHSIHTGNAAPVFLPPNVCYCKGE